MALRTQEQMYIRFLKEQVDGIDEAIRSGKIFNTEQNLREKQAMFMNIIQYLQKQAK